MNTGIYKSFDELIEVIKAERDRLQKNLASIEYEDLDDTEGYIDAFKRAVLPRIQSLADSCISYVEDSDISELQALQDEIKGRELNNKYMSSLFRRFGHNYYCQRFLYTVAFLNGLDTRKFVQPIDHIYFLLERLYNRCAFLVNIGELSDDSLMMISNLFHGYY